MTAITKARPSVTLSKALRSSGVKVAASWLT